MYTYYSSCIELTNVDLLLRCISSLYTNNLSWTKQITFYNENHLINNDNIMLLLHMELLVVKRENN